MSEERKYVDKRLLKFSQEGGKFMKMELGESKVVKYLGYKIAHDEKYDKTKYEFTVVNEEGETKVLSTSSRKTVGRFALVVPKSKIKITKVGEGNKTEYTVKVLTAAKPSEPVDEVEDQEEEEEQDDIDIAEEDDEEEEDENPFDKM